MSSLLFTNSLFKDVQSAKIFPDGKTFVDCLPKQPIEKIVEKYEGLKNITGFNLKSFVLENFEPPITHSTGYSSNTNKPVEDNIELLWDVLTRKPDAEGGSLISLIHPYIVPGGRFGEIYYWDSYFTMLGLHASKKHEVLENMVDNFSYLIDKIGYIPNGNRTYYIGRSQPPFYSLMIKLLASVKGEKILSDYLPQLEKEYHFWMRGAEKLNETTVASDHTVRMPDGTILNRYWDENDTPRPESYKEDIELSHLSRQESKKLYRHLRAAAESGWDFSSRWFKDEKSFNTIHTTEIIPVDLNCLILHLEQTIGEAYQLLNNDKVAEKYKLFSEKRIAAIQQYCWNQQLGFYVDYDFAECSQKNILTLAATFPLFFKIATNEQASKVADIIEKKFIGPGGVITTLAATGQQWDAPNGWAPLQWITIIALENYNKTNLAKNIANRWIQLNTDVFHRTGKLMEKYNVINTNLEAGGGEYPGQDGFGWTNGVLLALKKKYE